MALRECYAEEISERQHKIKTLKYFGLVLTIAFDAMFLHHMAASNEPSSFVFACKLLILGLGLAGTVLIMKIKKEKERIDDFLKTNFMMLILCLMWVLENGWSDSGWKLLTVGYVSMEVGIGKTIAKISRRIHKAMASFH